MSGTGVAVSNIFQGTMLGLSSKLLPKAIAQQAWLADYEIRGNKVKIHRQYYDNEQDAALSEKKVKMLNLPIGTKSAFSANYCDTVIQMEVDRLELDSIRADNEAATAWIQDVLEANSFEDLQGDLHESTLLDGDCYLMVSADSEGEVSLTLEPAFDGSSGMLVAYERMNGRRVMTAAIKIWSEVGGTRINVYYADRVEKWRTGAQGLTMFEKSDWLTRNGEPIGVPVVHFANRRKASDDFGISELENVLPLQDGLNRTIHSMVMAGELTAFQVYYVAGAPAPDVVSPGMFLEFGGKGLNEGQKFQVGSLAPGQITPFIEEAVFFIEQISYVSRTPIPLPGIVGASTASGEALKQREVGLLGKVRKFQRKASGGWKRVIELAARIQGTFGSEPPSCGRVYPQWRDAQLRNDAEVIATANAVRADIDRRTYLEMVAEVFGWDAQKIDGIVGAVEVDKRAVRNFEEAVGQ